MTVKGIDVASYQSADYSTSGLAFVMVKATEGTGYVNPLHAAQVAHGRAAGLVIGHYHFLYHGNAAAQADYFLAHAGLRAGDLIACDWEKNGATQADRDQFMARITEKAGAYRDLLYCNRSFWLTLDTENFAGSGLWIADPDSPAGKPNVTHAWTMHQYSSAGGLDRNVANFPTTAALKEWAAGTTPTPEDDVALTATQAKQLTDLHTNLMDIGRIGTTETHAAGYYLAHAADDAASARAGIAKAAAPALTDAQVAALAKQVAAAPGLADALAEAVAEKLAARLQS